jgi:hypothetical protein
MIFKGYVPVATVAGPDVHHFEKPIRIRVKSRIRIRIRTKVNRRIRIHIEVKIQELWSTDAQNEAMEGGGRSQHNRVLEVQNERVCLLVVAYSHHFDEEQDPDPHQSEK